MPNDKSTVGGLLGNRSLMSWVFGNFFSSVQATSGLVAILLLALVGYLFISRGTAPERLMDALLLVVGFYFGGATRGSAATTPN